MRDLVDSDDYVSRSVETGDARPLMIIDNEAALLRPINSGRGDDAGSDRRSECGVHSVENQRIVTEKQLDAPPGKPVSNDMTINYPHTDRHQLGSLLHGKINRAVFTEHGDFGAEAPEELGFAEEAVPATDNSYDLVSDLVSVADRAIA